MAESGGGRGGTREGEEGREGCGREGVGEALSILGYRVSLKRGKFAFCLKMGGRGGVAWVGAWEEGGVYR